ncbi:MerR-like DNA binding protein [Flavobacterium endophyticum]|uniref:MerR-like DNA binding protein n=1 Tax=Flavobacterium endophyticum TaxID=1540163 RepID=A0A495M6T9_9FLAO|nr:chaperone modulator CbpM [Flavobacterium endophyticum]RKS20363.1 MerR-like DNA binding protein [Flavobacterium endophyticum]
MKIERITISDYCNHYKIETTFIDILDEMGIIQFENRNNEKFLDTEKLHDLDRCRQLYYELHINPEGIDVILNLLQKQQELQDEIQDLKNRLRLHE